MGHAIAVFYVDFALAVAASWVLVRMATVIGRRWRDDDDDDSDGRGGWGWRRREDPGRPGPQRGPGPLDMRRAPVSRRPRARR